MPRAASPTFLSALENAARRLRAVHEERTATKQQAFEALATWMVWAMAVDDQLDQLVFKGEGYRERRASDAAGVGLPGVRYAWNVLKHQGRDLDGLVEETPGVSWPIQCPLIWREIRWLPLCRLPSLSGHETQKQAYQQHLQERPVRLVAQPITKFLLEAAAHA